MDVLVRVTVFSGFREAKVEAWALTNKEVQFVTGVNYYKGHQLKVADNFMLTWGFHPEDVAVEKVELGAALVFDPKDFANKMDDGAQKLIVSKPTKVLSFWITSANEKEEMINTYESFEKIVGVLAMKSKL